MSLMIKIVILISISLITITFILNKTNKNINLDKFTAIECGFDPNIDVLKKTHSNEIIQFKEKFYIKFYIIAITFLIFDLESILLYPITFSLFNSLDSNSFLNTTIAFITFFLFMLMLIIGLSYEYLKGAIDQ